MTMDSEPTDFKTNNTSTTGTAGGYGKYVFAGAVINTLGSILVSWGFILIVLILSQLFAAPKSEREVIPDSPAILFFMTPTYLCMVGPIAGAILGVFTRYYQGSKSNQMIAVIMVSAIQLLFAVGLFTSFNSGVSISPLLDLGLFALVALPAIVGSVLVPLILPKWVPHIR